MSEPRYASLEPISRVHELIASGAPLLLAGSRQTLLGLPCGTWIAGTIPYFMTEHGGVLCEDKLFVTPIPAGAVRTHVGVYDADSLGSLYRDAPEHGITLLILPAGTPVHRTFAERVSTYEGFLFKPVAGWVAGVRVDRIGIDHPAVVNGLTGEVFESSAVALHIELPPNLVADLDIVNIFEAADGDLIEFDEVGFRVTTCRINGKPVNLADYIASHNIGPELPLVGDYNGSAINVSLQKVDAAAHAVDLYAPVFPGVRYHFAKPVADYARAFASALSDADAKPAFACNCILNYIYGKLEGKKTGQITGPITFGEIAHQLLNQTMVRLYLREV